MRAHTLWLTGLALTIGACMADEAPTEPSTHESLARGGAGRYTAVDLGAIGALDINARGQITGNIESYSATRTSPGRRSAP